ncbi:ATP synthase subunit delta [subsurface metagenome]
MARKVNTQRYAQAVFEIALETKELDSWQSDLQRIASLAEDDAIVAFLESPKIPFDDKSKLLSEQLNGVNSLALNLVYLLAARGRLRSIDDIADNYQQLLDNYRGIEVAEVVTATALDEKDKRRLAEHLSVIVGKKVTLKTEVEPGLIGGVIAKIGGKLLNGSTRSKLDALRKELVRAGR